MKDSRIQFYIDKTEELQKGIEGFPFLYIEGVAACGKTTAVKMLTEKYSEGQDVWVNMANVQFLETEAAHISQSILEGARIVVFENMNRELTVEERREMNQFLENAPEYIHVIFISREHPDECLLPFLWQRKMEIIPQEAFFFTKADIQKMLMEMKCSQSANDVFAQSGGWPGCVDIMLRFAKRAEKYREEVLSAKELRQNYEVEGYIQSILMNSLSNEENFLLQKVGSCPLINVVLCEELFAIEQPHKLLQKLRRKGILKYDAHRECWKLAEIFQTSGRKTNASEWEKLADWYAKEDYIEEAFFCIKNAENQDLLIQYLQAYYDRIELSDIPEELLLSKKKMTPELCYLQGIYHYLQQEFDGLDREIERLETLKSADEFKKQEILLNLYYLKPDYTLERWMNLLKESGEKQKASQRTFRIYHMLGYSHTYLCGFRDVTDLFACSKKEENQNARIWKTYLGEEEWKCYQLARIDYYLETKRKDQIDEEDWELLYGKDSFTPQMNRARLYLAGKLMKSDPTTENEELFARLSDQMRGQADAIISFYSRWTQKSHLMAYWLRYSEQVMHAEVNEQNYIELCFMMKGYLQLKQFEKIERIIKKMIPYLQKYHRTRLLAEIMFQQAIVSWETDRHGQAIQNVIESFLVGAPYRYVDFYTNYGKTGKEVLEAYEEWCKANLPEKWHRKKKYQYGNVLRMPEAEYVGVILRLARKNRSGLEAKTDDEITPERLTMMETMVLQAISRGYSNSQICIELNLKLPTVKTHIYSLYKKLDVSGRVQAVNKGKEMGLV